MEKISSLKVNGRIIRSGNGIMKEVLNYFKADYKSDQKSFIGLPWNALKKIS